MDVNAVRIVWENNEIQKKRFDSRQLNRIKMSNKLSKSHFRESNIRANYYYYFKNNASIEFNRAKESRQCQLQSNT